MSSLHDVLSQTSKQVPQVVKIKTDDKEARRLRKELELIKKQLALEEDECYVETSPHKKDHQANKAGKTV
jgi:hypothetical protein